MKRTKSSCAIRPRKSKFIDIFRTTPVDTVCPNFFVLAHANGCTFDCEYCYLKSSLWHQGEHVAYSNLATMFEQVRKWIARDDLESYILNSGNLSDSLTFESRRPMVRELVEEFRSAERAGRKHTLLLLTKGGMAECKNLMDLAPCANVIVSFSVNSPEAAARYEKGAAPPEERLAAAAQLKARGWRLRMRVDPMIDGFDYQWTFDQVRRLAPQRVTLGCLRAEANLPRFVGGEVFAALAPAANPKGLSRYPRPVRMALYRQAVAALLPVCPVGLCEETPDVWDELGLDKEAKCCNCGS
jgi:DNA repair photolyase